MLAEYYASKRHILSVQYNLLGMNIIHLSRRALQFYNPRVACCIFPYEYHTPLTFNARDDNNLFRDTTFL